MFFAQKLSCPTSFAKKKWQEIARGCGLCTFFEQVQKRCDALTPLNPKARPSVCSVVQRGAFERDVGCGSILKNKDIKSFVVDVVYLDGKTRHSYNYFFVSENDGEEKLYCVDLTLASYHPNVDNYVYEVICCNDFLEHSEKCYKDTVEFIH